MKCIVLLFSAAFLASLASAGAAGKPNILFIAVDDLRPELAVYGASGMVTPHIDRLAGQGVRFDRAYCMVPTCGASRASLFSGIRPARNRFTNHESRASKDAPGLTTLNTHFKNHGYTTISLGKIFHHRDDNADGWSEVSWYPEAAAWVAKEARDLAAKGANEKRRGPSWQNGGDVPDETYADVQLAGHAIGKLRTLAAADKPFFLAVGFLKPHLPFVAPGAYFQKYPVESVRMPDNYYPPKNAPKGAVHSSGELRSYSDIPKIGILPEDKARELIRGYHAATSSPTPKSAACLTPSTRSDWPKTRSSSCGATTGGTSANTPCGANTVASRPHCARHWFSPRPSRWVLSLVAQRSR
jgi:iduronate 2-sulfatase